MQQKVWYIYIDGKKEGPYSILELKRHPKVTLDTFVWKEGFDRWKPIKEVPELKALFANEEEEPQEKPQNKINPQDEVVLDMNLQPPNFFWLIVAVLILLYVILQLFFQQ